MPLYEYRCIKCGHHFEKIQHFDSPAETVCPKCHGELERPLTAPAFQFKGSGWYVNDYAGKSSGASSGHESSTSTPVDDAKPATTGDKSSSAEQKPAGTESSAKPASAPAAKASTPAASS